jgi:hypothetical protein
VIHKLCCTGSSDISAFCLPSHSIEDHNIVPIFVVREGSGVEVEVEIEIGNWMHGMVSVSSLSVGSEED